MTGESPASAFKAQLDQMTQQLVAVERRAATLAELNRLLAQGQDPLALAQRAVDLVMRATGASGTFVYLWDQELERLVLRVATEGRQAAHVDRIHLRLGEGITGWSGLMRQTVVLEDEIQSDPRFARFPELDENRFRSMVAVPIVVPGGGLLGVFSVYGRKPATFDTHDVDLATEVGGLLANGLVQSQVVEDLRRQSAAAQFLTNIPAEATSSLQQCVDVMAASIRTQVDATMCTIELAERGASEIPIRPGLAFASDVDRSLAVRAESARSRSDVLAVAHELGPALEKFTTSIGNIAPLGALTCYRARPFTDADTSILEALGAQAAALIESLSGPSQATPLAGRLVASGSGEDADRVLRDLGWRPGPTHTVVVRMRSSQYNAPSAFGRIVGALREMFDDLEGVVLAPAAPSAALLVGVDRWKGFESCLKRTLKDLRFEAGGGVSAGIGPVASTGGELAVALDQAEWALSWAELTGRSAAVVHYQDVAHLRLLPRVALGMGESLRDALSRYSEITRYDLRHGTALGETLNTYLANRCSVAETASALFIHRNTLRQRLARIESLIGLQADEFEDWLVAALAARLAVASSTELTAAEAQAAATVSRRLQEQNSWHRQT